MIRRVSNRWKAFALLFPIVGMAAATALAQGPGSQRAFFQAWWGVVANLPLGPTDYLHFWNPAVTAEVDQGPGDLDANSVNFTPDSVNGWNMGTDNNKYVELTGPITNGTSYTVTAWIKPDITAMNANAFGGWVVSDRSQSGSTRDFQLVYRSDFSPVAFSMDVINTAGTFEREQNTNVADNVWQHLAGVVDSDAGTIELFVDGVSDGSTALTITPNDSYAGQASIGTASSALGGDNTKYHGSIGKVRFYQRVLTQTEIQNEIEADGDTGP